jgi:hypothetical protein
MIELLVGEWSLGDVLILDRTTKANLLHWTLALVMLGSFYAGDDVSRMACKVVAITFLGLTVWGLLSAASLGSVLGFSDALPAFYQVLHAFTAAVAAVFGFRKRTQEA